MSENNKISDKDILKITLTIIDLLIVNGEWLATCVFCLNHLFATKDVFLYRKADYVFSRKHGENVNQIYVQSNVCVKEYLENSSGVLTIASDRYTNYVCATSNIHSEINQFLAQYDLHLVAEDDWYFSVYPIN